MSKREGSLTHEECPYKVFKELFFGCSERQIHELIHEKLRNLAFLKKWLVNVEIGVKKYVNIREGSLTHYGGPHKVF